MILTENDLIRNISSKTWPDGIVIVQQPGTSACTVLNSPSPMITAG